MSHYSQNDFSHILNWCLWPWQRVWPFHHRPIAMNRSSWRRQKVVPAAMEILGIPVLPGYVTIAIWMKSRLGKKNGQIIGILPVLPGFSYGVFGDDLLGWWDNTGIFSGMYPLVTVTKAIEAMAQSKSWIKTPAIKCVVIFQFAFCMFTRGYMIGHIHCYPLVI